MIDVTLIRQNLVYVQQALAKRAIHVDLDGFLRLDDDYRQVRTEVERLRGDRKKVSGKIAKWQRAGEDAAGLHAEATALGKQLTAAETRLDELEEARQSFLDPLPNLPDADVPSGGKENNEVVREIGQRPKFGFVPKDHVELARTLGLVDYERGTKLGGSGFWLYRGNGALLEWALLNYFVEAHVRDGYEFVLPPHVLTFAAGYTAGQFPKFADEVFVLEEGEQGPERFLLPTAETALVNLHREETLPEAELPKRYVAYTPCYRKEAGGYRTAERGTLRGHQFNKVELFQFTHPDASDAAHEELLGRAEQLVAELDLHYQITRLAAQDTSPAMAKTYDVEVWLPSVGAYVEVSSVSNARDYQARRGNIRYRPGQGRSAYLHTLNASGLATSRLVPALLEQHQRADGTVAVPEALRRWIPSGVLTAALNSQ
ncbi:serine--tRNA ligase [Streptomyces sp. DG2A-72]|uniref:serine--tRNA ligase n=1 Tax=Streptomyces sp. DG2A-72 TaxID=3051386 RepID=UPI00265B97A3|nr:serine--tRNA ligase [Streptomyces sp. DG2A-72]MDO0936613.1 serine--tRNA ligase [Streptomyces sp. DG2A-72]